MFLKKNINLIPIEETSHATGSRKIIATKQDVPSLYFEAFTYGYLPSGEEWSMHKHDDIVEICIVIKGTGIVKDENGNIEPFQKGDRFVFPPNVSHAIENTSKSVDEFYFVRMKSK